MMIAPPERSSRASSDHVIRLVERLGVDEDQVIGVVGQPGQHILGPAADQPGPRRPDARVGDAPRRSARCSGRCSSSSARRLPSCPTATTGRSSAPVPTSTTALPPLSWSTGLSSAPTAVSSRRCRCRALAGGQQNRVFGEIDLFRMGRQGFGPDPPAADWPDAGPLGGHPVRKSE